MSLRYAGFIDGGELWVETVDGKPTTHRLLPAPMPEWPDELKAALRHRRNTLIHGACRCGARLDDRHLFHHDRCPACDVSIFAALEAVERVDPASYLAWRQGVSAGSEQPIPGE